MRQLERVHRTRLSESAVDEDHVKAALVLPSLSEVAVATKLADFARFANRSLIVALHSKRNEVLLVKSANGTPVLLNRSPVGHEPVSVQPIDADRFSVASLWARQISFWKLCDNTNSTECKLISTIDLPFAPRLQCLTPDGKYFFVKIFLCYQKPLNTLGSSQIIYF